MQWGWRIPFLFGGVCVLVGYFIRRGVEEPPVYERAVEQAKTEKIGLFTSIKRNPRSFVIVLLTRMGENGFAYLYPVFCVSYVITTLGQPRSTALWAVIIASMVQVATIPFFGVLSDRLGRKTVYIAGALLSMAWLVPFFLLLDTGATAAIILGFGIGLGIAYPAMLRRRLPGTPNCSTPSSGSQASPSPGSSAHCSPAASLPSSPRRSSHGPIIGGRSSPTCGCSASSL